MVRPLSNAAGALFAGKTPDAVNIWIGDGRAVTSSETDVITSLWFAFFGALGITLFFLICFIPVLFLFLFLVKIVLNKIITSLSLLILISLI